MVRSFVFIVLVKSTTCLGAIYNWYFSNGPSGSLPQGLDSNNCSISSPCRSISKINLMIMSMNNGIDSATIYLDGGDTWKLTSNTGIQIKRSNIALTEYDPTNTHAKPIIDGDGYYPHTKNGFLITVGGSVTITNIHISNIVLQNTHDTISSEEGGGGIIFNGDQQTVGPASVRFCEFYNMGWSAISIYRLPNIGGSATAIKLEYNKVHGTGWFPYRASQTGPQAFNGNDGYTWGHEARYNVITLSQNEGIGVGGFTLAEYNIISGTRNPALYGDAWRGSGPKHHILRYNILWRDNTVETTPNYQAYISINDERVDGDNSGSTWDIYGNIILGGFNCIQLKYVPEDGVRISQFGAINIYHNLLVDCVRSFVVQQNYAFSDVSIKHNMSVINSDASNECQHYNGWHNTTEGWGGFKVGPNYYYGDGVNTAQINSLVGNSVWTKSGADVFSKVNPLTKTSGWRTLASMPSFKDFYPVLNSGVIDAINPIAGFTQFLTNGTVLSQDPIGTTFILTKQSDNGAPPYGEFGPIIYHNVNSSNPDENLNAPTGLHVIN